LHRGWGSPLDFLVKQGLRFYLEVLVFSKVNAKGASKDIVLLVTQICNHSYRGCIASRLNLLPKYDFGVHVEEGLILRLRTLPILAYPKEIVNV
jgi:hypothetical protein